MCMGINCGNVYCVTTFAEILSNYSTIVLGSKVLSLVRSHNVKDL